MKKITQNLRWLVTLLTMIVSVGAWAQEETIASFSPNDYEGWTINNAEYASGGGGYYKLFSNASIVSPSCSWSNYKDIKITITARKFGGPDATQGKISVSQGTTELTSYSPTGTSLVASSALSITPSDGAITISCPGASSSKGCGVQSIVITGTPSSGTPTPTITVDPATVNATAEETDGTLAISYDNLDISSTSNFGIQYYNASNEVIDEPDWIVVEVESEEAGVSYMISYAIEANQGEARTAYCKVYAIDDDEYVYSNLITIKQAEYVAPSIATLPFVFDGGRAEIEDTEGLTQEGLGSDYNGEVPKLKFDNTGDWVLLQFDETPGNLSFDIKGNSFSGGTFTVQTSTDGKTYTNLETYTELGDTQTETFENLSSDVRFIKWVYTEKSTGNVGLGNIKLERSSTAPQIIVANTTIDVDANENSGTLEVTYKNIDPELADIYFYAADGETAATYDWIVAELDGNNNIEYIISANEGEARTAYLKVYGLDAETNDIYSSLITINQAAYVAPVSEFATLPFEFDDGKSAIESTDGLTQEGLDSDYGSSPKLKFNGTGDWVLLQFDEVPGNLSFDIKGNSFSGSTFSVQTSTDGKTYTDLKTYTELGDTQTETFKNLSSDVRYIKWIFTEKSSGNVGLGNIKLEKPVPQIIVANTTIDVDAKEHEGTLALSYNNLSITDREDFGIKFYDANNVELTEEPDWVEVLVAEENGQYLVSYFMLANEGKSRTAYCKVYAMDEETNLVYSDLITINQAAAPSDIVYTKVTSTDDITDGQYLIVYEEGSVAFNGGLATLDAEGNTIGVVLNNGTIEGSEETEAAEFTINVTEGSLKSASGKYIGVTSNSNGLKQSEASDVYKNSFAIGDDDYAIISAVFEGSTMKLLFNTSGRFRYYKETNQTNKAIQLYKKVEKVVIGSAGYATYVTKKAISINENINAYAVLAINEKSVALGKLTEVPAKTPIIVEGTAGEYPCTVIEEAEDPAINLLQVSDGTVTGDGAIYALANKDQGVGFYPVGNGIVVPAGKAYLNTSSAKNQVKGFLALGGLADAINNIALETANGTIFNIAGQKVQNITKGGLYIVNGKKVFVK